MNWNVSPKSPEGRIPYEGATGIKPNETKRNEMKRNETKRLMGKVQLQGLQATRPDLNGICGRVESYDEKSGLYAIVLEQIPLRTVHVKGCNLLACAVLPSDRGPSAACKHGAAPKEMKFLNALFASHKLLDAAEATAQSTSGAEMPAEVAVCEALWAFWSKRGNVIRADSWQHPFSIAVDAVINSQFNVARQFVRTGIFVRQWGMFGEKEFKRRWNARDLPELQKCLYKTRTDRGIVLYLDEVVECNCLRDYETFQTMKSTPKTRQCHYCAKDASVKGMKKCSKCRAAEYCSKECQSAHWKHHKPRCQALRRDVPAKRAAMRDAGTPRFKDK